MHPTTIQSLVDLNQRFYHDFAKQFSATRQRLQPGVARILERIPRQASVLDLGCGNGELARQLAAQGFAGSYLGLDFSAAMLAEAQQNAPASYKATFQQGDLSDLAWNAQLGRTTFDHILAFAVLHHLPGRSLRLRALRQLVDLMGPESIFIHSNWQFLNSQRLRSRIQPWSAVGLLPSEVEPGDYLLDWRRGGVGLRYVHHFSNQELQELAAASGFRIVETFHSDGEDGRLGLYHLWELDPHFSNQPDETSQDVV